MAEKTVDEWMKDIVELTDKEPKRLEGLDGTLQYTITGSQGGVWGMTIKEGKMEVKGEKIAHPDLEVTVGDSDFVSMMEHKVTGVSLLMSGKLKLVGDRIKGLKLQQLIP
jgi:putative sterol carrier protein